MHQAKNAPPSVKGIRVPSNERSEKRAPLTAAASGQIMQLSGAKKTKENLLGTKTTRNGRLHKSGTLHARCVPGTFLVHLNFHRCTILTKCSNQCTTTGPVSDSIT